MKNIYLFLFLLVYTTTFSQDGQLDTSFNTTISQNISVETIAVQDDGKILFGNFNAGTNSLIRLNSDGSIDSSFQLTTSFNGAINAIAIQNDQKIIVGGGWPVFLVRLHEDGSIDDTFTPSVDVNGSIQRVEILSNNKILVAGLFSNINNSPIESLAILNPEGSLDISFNVNLPPVTFIWDLDIQEDDKIIIAAQNDETSNQFRIFRRYLPDGTQDTTFIADDEATDSYIYDIEAQSDGKIMISGPFNHYNNTTRYSLARLNNDGSLDTSFDSYNVPHNGTTHTIFGVKQLEDNNYLINGSFSMYNGFDSNSIAKINNDGTYNTSFNIGTGPNEYVWISEIQDNGKILIGGDFTNYNGISIKGIARLNNTVLSINEIPLEDKFVVYPNPFENTLNVSFTKPQQMETTFELYTLTGQLIETEALIQYKPINTQNLPSGIYFLNIAQGNNTLTTELVKY